MSRQIECPDDIEREPDYDAIAEAADRANDMAAVMGEVPTYQIRPVTQRQLIDAIYFNRPSLLPSGVMLDPERFQLINGGPK